MMPDGTHRMTSFAGFTPDQDTQRRYRDALGRFATGVTVITAATAEGPVGMTANSFTSVSMSPPLVLWCLAKSAGRYDVFARAQHFAIHVLAADQRELALAFAKSGDAFDRLMLRHNDAGVPVFGDCLARFDCQTHALHEAGDHSIVVGQVCTAAFRDGEPLIFSQGRFSETKEL